MCMVTPEDGPEGGPPARGSSQVPAISLLPESRNGVVRGIALCATPSTNALVQGISQEKNEEKRLPVLENKTPAPCSEEWLFHFPKCGKGVSILFSKMICKKPPPPKKNPIQKITLQIH